MLRFLSRFLADDNGATAIEYGLIAALMFVAVLGAFSLFGGAGSSLINGALGEIADALSSA